MELALAEMMYGINLIITPIPKIQMASMCMRLRLWRVMQSAPSLYTSTKEGMNWKGNEKPVVDEVANLL